MTLVPTSVPLYSAYLDPRNGDNAEIGRGLITSKIIAACKNGDLQELAASVQSLIERNASINYALRECPEILGLGKYVTALCLAAEKTEDLELIMALISRGAIMHKLPSDKARSMIDEAAKKLWFENYKILCLANSCKDSCFNVLPREIVKEIFAMRRRLELPIEMPRGEEKSEEQESLEFWNGNAPACCIFR